MKLVLLLALIAAVPVYGVASQTSAVPAAQAGVQAPGPRYLSVDYNADGRIDTLAIESGGEAQLLVQLPDGRAEDRTEEAGLASLGALARAYWQDLTNDSWPDLFVVRLDGSIGLYVGDGLSFSDQTGACAGLVSPPVQSAAFQDLDRNGWIDLQLFGPDGSTQVVLHQGGLVFSPGTLGVSGLSIGSLGLAASVPVPSGAILMWGGSTPPSGFLLCDGSIFDPVQYPALAAAIGMTYGGGVAFRVPDMRQRFPLGKAAVGTGSTLGQSGGAIDHKHTSAPHVHSLSNHTHAIPAHAHPMDHNHVVPSHHHSTQGAGADISVVSDTSEQHVHDIGGKINSNGTGNTNRFVIADGTGSDTQINAGTGSPPGAAGEHGHGHGAFVGRVGNVSSGRDGDVGFTSQGASTALTGLNAAIQSGGPSAQTTGSMTPLNTGSSNPPYLVVNYIIAY